MSHIHVPDGILPLWLILTGWVITVAWIALAVRRLADEDLRRRIPLVGAVAALMLVAMSTHIVPLAYHINLTVLAGVLLGPWLSVPTAFVVVTILALIGHGGVTVIGLNTIVIGAEMALGWALFNAFVRWLGRARPALSAGVATVITLAITTSLLVLIVALGGSPAATRESGAFDPDTLSFTNPFAEGVIGSTLLGDEHGHKGETGYEHEAEAEEGPEEEPFDLRRFALIVYVLGSIGWLFEALVTAGIVGFVARVRPSLVFERATQERHAPPGDEGVHP
jgi:cobalt/nickel transport system permease protein